MNHFGADLAFSHAAEAWSFWPTCYAQWFPRHAALTSHRDDGQLQRLGVDRSVVLITGKQVFIDEKVRRKAYPDIALEYIANDVTGAPGWVCKALLADFIAYAVLPLGKAYLLPVLQLQEAWQRHGAEWIARWPRKIVAPNRGYNTISVGVPVDVLFSKLGATLFAHFDPVREAA
jgi:hypothetical protein